MRGAIIVVLTPLLLVGSAAGLSSCGGRVVAVEGTSRSESPASSASTGDPNVPPSSPSKTYTATATSGGYDHLEIWMTDRERDLCVHLHFVSPERPEPGGKFSSVEAPPEWTLREADRSKGAATCSTTSERGDIVPATEAKGQVRWPPPAPATVFPCRVSVHVTVTFDDGLEKLDADDIPVEGAC